MSAYDWINCPICQDKKLKLQKRLKEERKTLSDEDYEELLEELESVKSDEEETETPVRHDQEVWLNEKGNLQGYVSMGCQHCGAGWEHNFEVEPNLGEE